MNNELLLSLAKDVIKQEFDETIKIERTKLLEQYPFLNEKMATFVTLTKDGKLRGCIGSLNAHTTLLEDILTNAKSAAFSDLRFDRLKEEELSDIRIELSLLTKPLLCEYKNIDELKTKIEPFKHGVILILDNKRATFLPQVWEQLNSFDSFFNNLCLKAGYENSCLNKKPIIYLYEVLKIQ